MAPNRRRAALRLQLPVWSPFANTGHHCVWAGAEAMVWLWDADVVRPAPIAAASFEPHHAAAAHILPETVFHPRATDGVCLINCATPSGEDGQGGEGAELQLWRGGALVDSFWAAEPPHAARQAWFLQRHGLPAETQVATAAAPLAAEPWASPVSPGEWLAAREWPLAVAASALLLAAALWHEARYWRLAAAAAAVEAEFAARQGELGPVLAGRDELLRLRQRATAMGAILAEPSQARVMGLVDQALPSPAARFRRWRYQQGELRLTVSDPQLDPVAYVQALEPHFASVEVGVSRQGRAGGEENVDIILRLAPP